MSHRPNKKKKKRKISRITNKPRKNMSDETVNNKPEVSLNDFAAIVRIIDVASRRGAFEGKELSSVGNVRDKVETFLAFYAPKPEGEDQTSVEETPNESSDSDTTGEK